MTSFGGNRTVKLWTCCQCSEIAISMSWGDCPQCDHARCIDCEVKSHLATETVQNEENAKKLERSTAFATQMPGLRGIESASSRLDGQGQLGIEGSAPVQGASRFFPIVSGIVPFSIFVLQEETDKALIARWNRGLIALSNELLMNHHDLEMTSIHLFRVGADSMTSLPTIVVNAALKLGEDEEKQVQSTIFSSVFGLNYAFASSASPTPYPTIPIVFRVSRLRRSLDAPPAPPICQPRNRQFSPSPGTGASIGIAGSFEDTATLGCYLLVDEVPVVLTVNHLIPTTASNTAITHISQQDCYERLLIDLDREIESMIESGHSCEICFPRLFKPSMRRLYQLARAILESLFEGNREVLPRYFLDPHVNPTQLDRQACPFYRVCTSQEWNAVHRIAEVYAHSGRLFQLSDNQREMDWALFRIIPGSCFRLSENILNQSQTAHSQARTELHVQPVMPGAFVKSLGRSSGYQVGQISTTASIIFHTFYVTQEWCVVKRTETPLVDWVEGGIGVEGDSGALIVDEESNAVYGMLWGRTGDGPATATIFSPMTEILHDIKSRTMARKVELVRRQEMPRPDPLASQMMPVETVPILASLEDKMQDVSLEESALEFGTTRLSSADTRHPHSFERYRGHDRTNRNTPRTTPAATIESTGSSEWPGVHTYVRYVVAPEQE